MRKVFQYGNLRKCVVRRLFLSSVDGVLLKWAYAYMKPVVCRPTDVVLA